MYTYIYLIRMRKSERQPKTVQSKGGGGVGIRDVQSKGSGGDKGGGEKTKLVRGVEAKVTVYDLRNAYLPKKTDIGSLHLRKRALYLLYKTHCCYCCKHVKRAHTQTRNTRAHTHRYTHTRTLQIHGTGFACYRVATTQKISYHYRSIFAKMRS